MRNVMAAKLPVSVAGDIDSQSRMAQASFAVPGFGPAVPRTSIALAEALRRRAISAG